MSMNRLRMVEEKKEEEEEGDLVELEPSSCGYHQHEALNWSNMKFAG